MATPRRAEGLKTPTGPEKARSFGSHGLQEAGVNPEL